MKHFGGFVLPSAGSGAEAPKMPGALTEQRDAAPTSPLVRRRTPRRRRILFAGSLAIILLLGYYLVSLFQVYATGTDDQACSVDAIVVMGAAQYDGRPSPQLASRLDHVVELWPHGLATIVVVTGGNRPGDRFTEAEASATYLIERGIPEASIVLEDRGATSFESLERVAGLVAEGTGSDDNSVLVVTDPYHSLRSRLIAEEVGMTAYVSPTNTSVVTGFRSLERHIWEAGGVAIGRLLGFGRLSELTD
jgi:uncharacterized SAM-binding protein YcdF (DUF218 family)